MQSFNDCLGLGGQKNEEDYYSLRKSSSSSIEDQEDALAPQLGSDSDSNPLPKPQSETTEKTHLSELLSRLGGLMDDLFLVAAKKKGKSSLDHAAERKHLSVAILTQKKKEKLKRRLLDDDDRGDLSSSTIDEESQRKIESVSDSLDHAPPKK